MNVLDFIKNRRVYLDGAIGSELLKQGFDTSHADKLNLTNPDAIIALAKSYLDAGSNIIFTNSFGCNLLKHKCTVSELDEMITAAVKNAKTAAFGRENVFVGYSAGPLTELLQPFGKLSFEEAYAEYKVQAEAVGKTNADFIVCETFTDIQMLKAAILAFKENSSLPVWASMSFNDNGRTFSGNGIRNYALIAEGLGADVLGINCGFGPDKMLPLAKELLAATSLPVYIKPNAGLPRFISGKTSYDIDAEKFAAYMQEVAQSGVAILGGCCGTNPEYVKKTIEKTADIPLTRPARLPCAVCSATEVTEVKPFITIGERVNPTGKPRLKQALLSDDIDYVTSMCVSQLEKGADVLDFNVGMSGVDEPTLLPRVIAAAQAAVNCPICIDSSNASAIENALRIAGGVPIINSVNGDDEVMDKLFPLAKKYGAYLIAICLDKNGIPETSDGRLAIAKRILARAADYGIPKDKLFFDALTLAVSVNTENANVTLNTVKALNLFGLNTVLGLSNVSFGLPARDVINGAFLSLAKSVGLTAAIVNPDTKPNTNELAVDLLLGKDANCEKFITAFSDYSPVKICSDYPTSVFDCILKGLKTEGLNEVKRTSTAENYLDVINRDIIGALNEVGARYESGRAFLPQLIIAADAAAVMLDYIKTSFISDSEKNVAVMLIATVKGDIHDIGKNIVKAVLSNYGYKIYDLGKDVSTETIIDNIKLRKPQIVGLSALMTTSLCNMEESVRAIKNYDKNIIVMVGGAVVSDDFCKTIGADIYSADAQEAVRKLAPYFSVK